MILSGKDEERAERETMRSMTKVFSPDFELLLESFDNIVFSVLGSPFLFATHSLLDILVHSLLPFTRPLKSSFHQFTSLQTLLESSDIA